MRHLTWLLLVVIWQPSWAQVYTYLDADGNRVYTDQPHKGAQPVTLPPPNRLAAPPHSVTPKAKAKPAPKRRTHYNMVRILAPEPDGTVNHGAGEVVVTLTSDPALQAEDRFELLLDDQPTSDPSNSPVMMLHNVDRGAHRLAVRIVDGGGITVEQTAAQTFYMQRVSLAQKRRVNPCKEADWGIRPECPLSQKPSDD